MEQKRKALHWSELAKSTNPLLELTSQIYERTGGLCEAGPGPGGIGVSTKDGARIYLFLSFSPASVQNSIIFPEDIGQYQVQVAGCWDKSRELVRPEELEALLDDPDPATQKVAAALRELGQETHTVSSEECHEAFDVLAEWEMREVYGAPDEAPPTRQTDAEELESSPTLCQL